jgi:hypothetical protein
MGTITGIGLISGFNGCRIQQIFPMSNPPIPPALTSRIEALRVASKGCKQNIGIPDEGWEACGDPYVSHFDTTQRYCLSCGIKVRQAIQALLPPPPE